MSLPYQKSEITDTEQLILGNNRCGKAVGRGVEAQVVSPAAVEGQPGGFKDAVIVLLTDHDTWCLGKFLYDEANNDNFIIDKLNILCAVRWPRVYDNRYDSMGEQNPYRE